MDATKENLKLCNSLVDKHLSSRDGVPAKALGKLQDRSLGWFVGRLNEELTVWRTLLESNLYLFLDTGVEFDVSRDGGNGKCDLFDLLDVIHSVERDDVVVSREVELDLLEQVELPVDHVYSGASHLVESVNCTTGSTASADDEAVAGDGVRSIVPDEGVADADPVGVCAGEFAVSDRPHGVYGTDGLGGVGQLGGILEHLELQGDGDTAAAEVGRFDNLVEDFGVVICFEAEELVGETELSVASSVQVGRPGVGDRGSDHVEFQRLDATDHGQGLVDLADGHLARGSRIWEQRVRDGSHERVEHAGELALKPHVDGNEWLGLVGGAEGLEIEVVLGTRCSADKLDDIDTEIDGNLVLALPVRAGPAVQATWVVVRADDLREASLRAQGVQ